MKSTINRWNHSAVTLLFLLSVLPMKTAWSQPPGILPAGAVNPGGGMEGDSGMGMSGPQQRPMKTFSYSEGGKNYKAAYVRTFHYVPNSFRPTVAQSPSGWGSEMGAGTPGGGMGSEGAMASGGMTGGGLAMGGSAGYGMEGGYSGPGSMAFGGMMESPANRPLTIHAYRSLEEKTNGRPKIKLLVATLESSLGMGAGKEMGMGMGMASGGEMDGSSGFGAMSMAGGGLKLQPFIPKPAEEIPGSPGKENKGGINLPEDEVELVTDMISQILWKEDAVRLLYQNKGQGDSMPEIEKLLRELLKEQYETQLLRQEMEVAAIKKRLDQLEGEITRRKNAKERVVDVQLGRLLLDAQGLLKSEG